MNTSHTALLLGALLGLLMLTDYTLAHPSEQRRCLRSCPQSFDPVCDNEGTTHPNQCLMEIVACRRRVDLQVTHTGACQSRASVTGGTTPKNTILGRIISLFSDREKESSQKCSYICPLRYRPVCGSNLITFPNDCAMKSHACWHQLTLTVLHQGPCTAMDLQ